MLGLTNWPFTDDSTSAIPTTGIAYLSLFLAAQLLIQATTSRFICVDMAVNGLATNTDLIGNLDGAQLH